MISMNDKTRVVGGILTDTSVNIIQDGLDEIKNTWGYPSAGSYKVSKGEKCNASIINNWLSWLKSYASRMGSTSLVSGIDNVSPSEVITQSKLDQINNGIQSVKNYCNRSECNKSECNRYECNRSESNRHESNSTRESNTGEGKISEVNMKGLKYVK